MLALSVLCPVPAAISLRPLLVCASVGNPSPAGLMEDLGTDLEFWRTELDASVQAR